MRLSALLRSLRIEEPEDIVPPDRIHRRNHRESLVNPKISQARSEDSSPQTPPALD